MALPPDPKNEAEKGLKSGAGAVASILKGVFDAIVSAMTKILPGTASTPTDSETPTASLPKSNQQSTTLNLKIFEEAKRIAEDKERQMSEKIENPILPSKGAEQSSDAEKELAAKLFAHDINKINQLPPTDAPRSKPPPKPRPKGTEPK